MSHGMRLSKFLELIIACRNILSFCTVFGTCDFHDTEYFLRGATADIES